MKTRTMLATLALGATIAFAGPAFADKMKATLDSKSEVPPNTSAARGTAASRVRKATSGSNFSATGCSD